MDNQVAGTQKCVDYILEHEYDDFVGQIKNMEPIDNHIYYWALFAAYGNDGYRMVKDIINETLKEEN